jgi:hypothetical protein
LFNSGGNEADMKRTFAAVVERTAIWDKAKPPQEQPGFEAHAGYMGSLEAEGFIALAGLMQPSDDVLFIFRADSEEQIRERMGQDPWQREGRTRLVRLEELAMRNAPSWTAD